MNKRILILSLFTGIFGFTNAQMVTDTVSVGGGYANQVWYSLENDNQASDPLINWEIAVAATSSQSSDLTTSILFNSKIGSLYEIPGSSVANFSTADTTGINGWSPLYNSDSSWTLGAFNMTTFLGGFDYGWGSYNTSTHNIEANRIFVIKYTAGGYKKLYIGLNAMSGIYTLTYSNLDNTSPQTQQIDLSTYGSKNFVYFSLNSNAIIDREPASVSWDLLFGQYASWDYDPPYTVTGVLHNHGVEAIKVYPVNDSSTFESWETQMFTTEIDEIGFNWKAYTGVWTIEDSTVYFVKNMDGDIWKMVFTGFGGSSNGNVIFTKEKMSSVGVNELTENSIFLSVFPNPAEDIATIASFHSSDSEKAELTITDLTGKIIFSESTAFSNGKLIKNILLDGFSSGIYLVNMVTPTSSTTQKLIIK